MTTGSGTVLEILMIKLKPSVSDKDFVEINESFVSWIAKQPGCLAQDSSHEMSGDDYVHMVHWESVAAAKLASVMARRSVEYEKMREIAVSTSMLVTLKKPALEELPVSGCNLSCESRESYPVTA